MAIKQIIDGVVIGATSSTATDKFSWWKIIAAATKTIPEYQQMAVHGELVVEATGTLVIEPEAQVAVRT